MKPKNRKLLLAMMLGSQALLLSACSDSDSSDTGADDVAGSGLPESLYLSLLDASTGAYYSYNTSTDEIVDLNEAALASADSAVQKLQIIDTSVVGHFYHWADFRLADDGDELLDMKYLLMRPSYLPGAVIDADQFTQLAHFHDDELAAHDGEEFRDPEVGSNKEVGLLRLNTSVAAQADLEEEMAEVMPDGETLCRAFVDPYVQFELEHEEDHEEEHEEEEGEEHDEEHAHGDLVHFALSDSGRLYFFAEGEAELEQIQGFVSLDNVSTVSDCTRTTIARVSEDGVLVFIPDTQMLYLVDSHGGDFHQHSTWDMASLLPSGVRADLLAVIGEGAEHDHEEDDHSDDDHSDDDHDEEDHDEEGHDEEGHDEEDHME